MSKELPVTVTYKSFRHPQQGWDGMQVIYQQEGRVLNSFVIARDDAGKILRKTDLVLDRWEIIENPEDLRAFQACFDDRDKLNVQQQTGAAETSHVFESGEKVRVKKDGRVGTIKQRYGGDNAVNTSNPTRAVETYVVRFGNEITPGESFTADELESD